MAKKCSHINIYICFSAPRIGKNFNFHADGLSYSQTPHWEKKFNNTVEIEEHLPSLQIHQAAEERRLVPVLREIIL